MGNNSPFTIRVAILGGGITGTALLRGLLRYPHIAADIFEPRPAFREEGLGLVLVQNTENMLRAIDPSLRHCLDRAGAVHSVTEVRLASGPDAGKKIDAGGLGGDTKRTVGPQALLNELLRGLPPRMVHTNARLASIAEHPDGSGAVLVFADGTQKRYDVVVGADGAHGLAREHVLGAADPALHPTHTRVWGLPVRVSASKARRAMGGGGFVDPRRPAHVVWVGDGNMVQHGLQGGGGEVHAAAYVRQDEFAGGDASWARLFTPEEFGEALAGNETQACRGVVELIQNVYTVQLTGISQLQHQPAQRYATSSACLVGDAAHCMSLFPGASAALGLEEALVLSTVLGRVPAREAVAVALGAFERVCGPRAEQAARDSAECGLLLTGRAPGVGLDPELLARGLRGKWDFLARTGAEELRAAAAGVMDEMMMAGGWWQ